MIKKITSILPVIGILLFIYVIYNTGTDKIMQAFFNINYAFLIFVPIFAFLIIILKAWKWQIILKSLGIKIGLYKACRLWCIGFAAGLVTPGKAGDAIRAYYLKKETGSFTKVFSSVFVDRALDLITVIIMGIVSIFAFNIMFDMGLSIIWSLFAGALLIIGLVVFSNKKIMHLFFSPIFHAFVPKKFKVKVKDIFNKFYSGLGLIMKNKMMLLYMIILTIITWIFIFYYVHYISILSGIEVSFLFIIVIWPIITLIEILPISVSGLGTREAALVFFLGLVNVKKEYAIVFSLIYLLLAGWIYALPGFYFWLKEKKN